MVAGAGRRARALGGRFGSGCGPRGRRRRGDFSGRLFAGLFFRRRPREHTPEQNDQAAGAGGATGCDEPYFQPGHWRRTIGTGHLGGQALTVGLFGAASSASRVSSCGRSSAWASGRAQDARSTASTKRANRAGKSERRWTSPELPRGPATGVGAELTRHPGVDVQRLLADDPRGHCLGRRGRSQRARPRVACAGLVVADGAAARRAWIRSHQPAAPRDMSVSSAGTK